LITIRRATLYTAPKISDFLHGKIWCFSLVRSNNDEIIFYMHNLTAKTLTVPMEDIHFRYLQTPFEVKDITDLDLTKVELPLFSYRWILKEN